MKITISPKSLDKQVKKYCRLILTEDAPSWHRLVETKDGQLEYRMGTGKRKDMTARKFRLFVRSIVQAAKGHQIEHLALQLDVSDFTKLEKQGSGWFYQTLVENLHLAAYEFTMYKTKAKKVKELQEIVVCGGLSKKEVAAFKDGEAIALAMNTARDIVNTPACDMTPTDLATAAKSALAGTKAIVKVLGEKELKKLKMGALLAVGQGSHNESKLIIIEYKGGVKKDKPIVLAGKGITYDTGGLTAKPVGGFGMMQDMHMDMSGGGAVIGAMAAMAKLKLKKNVIALIPAAENAISDKAMRPGDIVTSMSGKTIEVTHPDAEGRMVLADAITYSERYQPKLILDVAGLTGAAIGALGHHASAVMTKDEKLQNKLCTAGEVTGDLMWPLPLWDEYSYLSKSQRADVANLNTNYSRFGGAIEGGIFISNFIPKKVPWAHLDIAPRMIAVPQDKLAKGATGEPVRMLVKIVAEY